MPQQHHHLQFLLYQILQRFVAFCSTGLDVVFMLLVWKMEAYWGQYSPLEREVPRKAGSFSSGTLHRRVSCSAEKEVYRESLKNRLQGTDMAIILPCFQPGALWRLLSSLIFDYTSWRPESSRKTSGMPLLSALITLTNCRSYLPVFLCFRFLVFSCSRVVIDPLCLC